MGTPRVLGRRWDTGNAGDCAEELQGGQARAGGSVRPHEQSQAENGNP